MISIKDFSFSYEREILKDINLDIKEGSFVSIIGPNGAGKSTLLKAICALLDKYNGQITIDNIDIKSYSKKKLAQKLAYVQQEHSSVFDYNVEEVIEMGFYSSRKSPFSNVENDKLLTIMKETETYELREKSILTLSGGEKQRVFIARALAQGTKILLLDEPIANLDLKHQRAVMKLCRYLTREKAYTIITVLHDINLASIYSDYIAIIKDGCLLKYDKPSNLIEKNLLKSVYEVDLEIVKHRQHSLVLPEL